MELAHKLLTTLFPPRCLLCQKTIHETAVELGVGQRRQVVADIDICGACFQALPNNRRCCSHCAVPLPDEQSCDVMCGRCIRKLPVFDYCHSPFRYQGEIIRLVHQLKFSDRLTSTRSIGEILSSVAEPVFSDYGKPDCLLPVPLHTGRLRSRGFNQSVEIARQLSRKHGISIDRRSVERSRSTGTQTGLDAKSRQKNIKGAFSLRKEIGYRHVLIVDDVVTTGATVSELARLLKKHGVETVGVLSFARAPMRG